MTKSIVLASLLMLIALVKSQPGPRVGINGVIYMSTIPNWACTIDFNTQGVPQYTESLSYNNQYNDNHVMDPSNSGHLDSISWTGTSCYCWVVIFEHSEFAGDSLGIWIQTIKGSVDLTFYNFLDDGDAIGDDDYAQWNTQVSSYRIYCY
jgi:hypothetical protein